MKTLLKNKSDKTPQINLMKEKVKVAGGQGFWGDLLTAPVEQVRGGAIDYLMLDYLAEVVFRNPRPGAIGERLSWRETAG